MDKIYCSNCHKKILVGIRLCPFCGAEQTITKDSATFIKSPFEILQVTPNAEDEAISAAYRNLAKRNHPDTLNNGTSEERMKELNWAYSELCDPIKRSKWSHEERLIPKRPKYSARETSQKPNDPTQDTSSKPSQASKPSTLSNRAIKQKIKWPILLGVAAMLIGIIIFSFCSSKLSPAQTRSNNTSTNAISHTPTKPEFSTSTPGLNANPPSLSRQLATIQWQLIFKDLFDSNENDWKLDLNEMNLRSFQPGIEDGKLYFLIKSQTNKPLVADIRAAGKSLYSDFVLSFDVQLKDGNKSSSAYGAFFRYTGDSNYYSFVIVNNYYGFFITNGATYRTIIDWTMDPVVKPKDVNHITVIAIGSEFAFIVNEKTAAIINDNELNTGLAGVYVQTTGMDNVLIEFDNLKIWVPENSLQNTATAAPTIKPTISLQTTTTSTATQILPNTQNPPTMTPTRGFDDPN